VTKSVKQSDVTESTIEPTKRQIIAKEILSILNHPDNDGLTQGDIATYVNLNPSTVCKFLHPENYPKDANSTRVLKKMKQWLRNHYRQTIKKPNPQKIASHQNLIDRYKKDHQKKGQFIPIQSQYPLGGYIYIFQDDQNIKIGKSKSPEKRYSDLKTGNLHLRIRMTIRVSDYNTAETVLHNILEEYNVQSPIKENRATEWFSYPLTRPELVKKVCLDWYNGVIDIDK